MERWKLLNEDKKPNLNDYDSIVDEWKSRDKVANFLGVITCDMILTGGATGRDFRSATTFQNYAHFVSNFFTKLEH